MNLVIESREDLVAALRRHDEIRVLPDVLTHCIPVLAEAEEIGLLLDQGLRVVGAFTGGNVRFLQGLLAGDTVVGLVVALVDVSLFEDLFVDLPGKLVVTLLGCPDEVGIGDPEFFVDAVEGPGLLIDELLGRLPGLFGGVLNLQAVLIEPDQEPCLLYTSPSPRDRG